jgi:hypothetical protein
MEMEHVRYAAVLDTGEGFMAFGGGYLITPTPMLAVGEVELPAGRLFPDGFAVWPWHKLRRMAPADGEYIYLVGSWTDRTVGFVKMVTDLGDGTALIGTDHPVEGAIWGGKVVDYVFDRAAYIAVPV